MRRIWCWSATSLLLATAGAEAATVLSQQVTVEVLASGGVRERTALKVRLDSADDLDRWSSYPVYLDNHRSLEVFDAWITSSQGKRTKVKRKQQDRVEYSGQGIVESSVYFHVVDLPGLEVGATLDVRHTVAIDPYYPTGQQFLLRSDPISELEVVVRGPGVRWRLDGPAAGLEVEKLESGVRISGRDLEGLDPPVLAAAGAASWPVLRYAWGADGWQAVSGWYAKLLADLPRDSDVVRRLAAELTSEDQDPRQRLEALLAHLRRKIRYVAVEVGIGGYKPSPPAEVAERKWGDCKDKSLLLIDLLRQVGIEAHPALILSDRDRRIETEFPSPAQFNHLIVAVPSSAVEVHEDDPVADGYLFLDPTQTHGGARWLHPGVQDQDALVVTAEGGVLARTPLRPEHESRTLAIDLTVDENGDAAGRAGLRLGGSRAIGFIVQMENAPPERTVGDVLAIFNRLLPGAKLHDVGWQREEGDVPAIRMSAAVEIEGLIAISGRSPSFQLPSLGIAPEPRMFDDLAVAASYPARQARSLWRLALPEGWCPPRAKTSKVENAVGVFSETVTVDGAGRVDVERVTELRRRWIEPEELEDFKALAVAEYQASRRRIRLKCEG
ncbi:MAG: transglutaminase domain-containing protein [Thermoanaerobaculia bacterium]